MRTNTLGFSGPAAPPRIKSAVVHDETEAQRLILGVAQGDRVLAKSVAERLIHALRMQAKQGKIAVARKQQGAIVGVRLNNFDESGNRNLSA